MMQLTPIEFERVRVASVRFFGIQIGQDKRDLTSHRIVPLVEEFKLPSVDHLLREVEGGNRAVLDRVADALTVNETSFFRDPHVWSALNGEILPQLLDHKKASRSLRIWSAASSSGQEPYSVAMALNKLLGAEISKWSIEIIATDVSGDMVARTAAGTYHRHEIERGLSPRDLATFFEDIDGKMVARQNLKRLIKARQLNLVAPAWPLTGQFDLILVRNVLIYFGQDVKQQVLTRAASILSPGGRLVMGASEGALGVPDMLTPVRSSGLTSFVVADGKSTPATRPLAGAAAGAAPKPAAAARPAAGATPPAANTDGLSAVERLRQVRASYTDS